MMQARGDKKTGAIVICHGSRSQRANDAFVEFVGNLDRRSGDMPVFPAFMELLPPTLEDQARRLVDLGVTHILIMPHFLAAGVHSREDIPKQAEVISGLGPGLSYEVLPCLENDPLLEDLVLQRITTNGAQP